MRLVDEFLKHCDEQSYCVGNLYLLRKSLLKLLGAAVVWQRFLYCAMCTQVQFFICNIDVYPFK